MNNHTDRDIVWSQALQYALADDSFNIEAFKDEISEDVSETTVHDTLDAMVAMKWLSTETSKGQVWTQGPRLQDGQDVEDIEDGGESETNDFETDEVTLLSECDVSSPSELSTDTVYIGMVDRIVSGSGNAIINIKEGAEVNLGPIDESAEGEKVHFKPEGGNWGKCLDDEFTYETYDPHDGESRPTSKAQKSHPSPYKRSGSGKTTKPSDPDNLNELLTGHQ